VDARPEEPPVVHAENRTGEVPHEAEGLFNADLEQLSAGSSQTLTQDGWR
jgi:hypothetical protein